MSPNFDFLSPRPFRHLSPLPEGQHREAPPTPQALPEVQAEQFKVMGAETVLYSFVGGTEGYNCSLAAGLVRDSAGNLYGTTELRSHLQRRVGLRNGVQAGCYRDADHSARFAGGTDGMAPQAGRWAWLWNGVQG